MAMFKVNGYTFYISVSIYLKTHWIFIQLIREQEYSISIRGKNAETYN